MFQKNGNLSYLQDSYKMFSFTLNMCLTERESTVTSPDNKALLEFETTSDG